MKNIAVIEGGYSHEKVISLKSSKTVFENIDRSKYQPTMVRIDEEGWFGFDGDGNKIAIDRSDFSLNGIKFDLAFIVIHGTPGEDGKLQAYFDMLKIPYTTCGHLQATITFDKFMCNRFLQNFDINVAKAISLKTATNIDVEGIVEYVGLPCFVKPADGGSSFGVTKVQSPEQLKEAVELALEHGTAALIEEFLEGREVTNGVYEAPNGVKVLPITEIISQNDFFDFDAKYNGKSSEVTPANLSQGLTDKIKAETKRVYEILNLKGICRADYIIKGDTPYLIEINTVPGQSAQSIIPQMAAHEGISLKQLFNDVIEVALKS